jgi:nitroimidazol reductase NimA-like FMN-containing flavoprotein (pyridoxamine 5'-phosphate oxidase superfamily)
VSAPPELRRADRTMVASAVSKMLERGFSGHLAVIGEDGHPYCVPLLYVWMDRAIWLHQTIARGHLRRSIEREPRACFEIDEYQGVFDYGRFECDSGLAYRSVILFGTIAVVRESSEKQRFCSALMAKYRRANTDRPKDFYPRLNEIAVYTMTVERMTGKEVALPALSEQWPAKDRTKTPDARP